MPADSNESVGNDAGVAKALEARTAAVSPPRRLGLWDAVSIIVGVVIGAGIYETAPLVFANVNGPAEGLWVWALGGVLSLVGACCYAELASTYPRSGGDYVYLSRAYGPWAGFLFGWSQLAVILTGSIGMMAYVFADYASHLFRTDDAHTAALAASAVVALTALNVASVQAGAAVQNVLSWVKVLGLLLIALAGFGAAASSAPFEARAAERLEAEGNSFGLAMILVLYTYGGWNDAAFVAAEVRDRRKNMPRALLLGTGLVTLVYLIVNAAFLSGLGFEAARSSRAIAADVLSNPFGDAGGAVISVLVMISALGAVNALVFTGARVHAGLGLDFSALSVLGRWHPRFHSPVWALGCQGLIALAMIGLLGTAVGRGAVDRALSMVGLSPVTWSARGGFDTLLRCTAPVFWTFFLMTGISVFVLRVRDRAIARPFRVPAYPLLPLVFCGTCLYMLVSAVEYAGRLTLIGVLLALSGIPLYFASKRRPGRRFFTPVESAAE